MDVNIYTVYYHVQLLSSTYFSLLQYCNHKYTQKMHTEKSEYDLLQTKWLSC